MRRLAIVISMATACAMLASGCTSYVKVPLGQEFTLAPGQEVSISGEPLRVMFDRVIEDSRCPTGVVCIWEGRVGCLIRMTYQGNYEWVILTKPGLSDDAAGQTYREYRLNLSVAPYPQAGKAIAPGDYRLIITVSK